MKDKIYIYRLISEFVPKNARVLDLGCGDGSLLKFLIEKLGSTGYGIDMKFANILACTKQGIHVYQDNIEKALKAFNDKSFDVSILSQTLQEIHSPVPVLKEMLRVGKKGIVTFPNFGHWRIRFNLLFKGYSPKTKTLPYEWHNTPNIRVITIKDFRILCDQEGFKIVEELPLFHSKWARNLTPKFLKNLLSPKALFVLEKI